MRVISIKRILKPWNSVNLFSHRTLKKKRAERRTDPLGEMNSQKAGRKN